jgi:GT2 family glycosyltransferase
MPPKDHKAACIVLNWNGGREIERCLQSLQETEGQSPGIIVVDNGSTDGSLTMIEDQFPSIHIIRLPRNAGLACARNEAVRWTMTKDFAYLFFVDDDAFVSPQCLPSLIAAAEASPSIGIVTPRILGAEDKDILWFDGGLVNIFGDTVHVNMGKHGSSLDMKEDALIEHDFATGCCMLVRQDVFKAIGLFDEDYFIYSEDADFSFRARNAGYRIVHVPSARAWHQQSADTRRNRGKWFRDYYATRNRLLLIQRRIHGFKWLVFLGYFVVRYLVVAMTYFLVTLQFRRIQAVAQGVSDFVGGRFGERYA